MQKYVTRFITYYFLMTILVATITTLLKMDSSLSLVTVAIASAIVGDNFSKDHRRLPTKEEINDYALSAMLGAWVVSLLLTIIVLSVFASPSEIDAIRDILSVKTTLIVLPFILVFMSVIYYFAIRWAFSWQAKQSFK